MRFLQTDDTIAAIATGRGVAARGVVRLSGPGVWQVVESLRAAEEPARPLPRGGPPIHLELRLRLAAPWGPIPCRLLLWPGARSYTRQPSAELHLPAAGALADATLRAALAAGARAAAPGEFTWRAFLAGRIELSQAEAVLGVVEAQDRQSLQIALEQLAGGLARPLTSLRERLLNLLADIEAGLDFVEEDLAFVSAGAVRETLEDALAEVDSLTTRLAARGEREAAPKVVLWGPTNAGKSSLFNALAPGGDSALTSPEPGTTRDVLQRRLTLDGIELLLLDTAGLSDAADDGSSDEVERAGQQRTRETLAHAALALLCCDASDPDTIVSLPWELRDVPQLLVSTKCDVLSADPESLVSHSAPRSSSIATSSRTGAGLETLRQEIARRLASRVSPSAGAVVGTAVRVAESLWELRAALAATLEVAAASLGDELVAAELRLALDTLAQVTGEVGVEDILDRVFSRFCIGK